MIQWVQITPSALSTPSGAKQALLRPIGKALKMAYHESNMKPHPEMIEGPEAWERFRAAMKAIVKVPKERTAAKPVRETRSKKKKPAARKG